MKKLKQIEELRKLSNDEIATVIRVFDSCINCWKTNTKKCKCQEIRNKLGLRSCSAVKLEKEAENKIASGEYKLK